MTSTSPGPGPEKTWGAELLGLDGRRLVLASASPQRADILRGLGIPFETRPVDLVETAVDGEAPAATAVRLAVEKATAAVRPGDGDSLILGADTLVVLDDAGLGKPADPGEARAMLGSLSGRSHVVVTALAIVSGEGKNLVSGRASTSVQFRSLSEKEIDILVDSRDAMNKAGGYGIQGLASLAVESIQGDYFNVVGLPLGLLRQLINKAVTV